MIGDFRFWIIILILVVLIVFTELPRVLWIFLKKIIWLGVVFAVLYFVDAFFLV